MTSKSFLCRRSKWHIKLFFFNAKTTLCPSLSLIVTCDAIPFLFIVCCVFCAVLLLCFWFSCIAVFTVFLLSKGAPPLSSLEKDKDIDFDLLQDLMDVDIDPLDIDLEKDPLAAKVFKVRQFIIIYFMCYDWYYCYCFSMFEMCLHIDSTYLLPELWVYTEMLPPVCKSITNLVCCVCSQPISSTWYDYWGADYGTYGYNPYIGGVGIPVAKPPVAAEKPGSQGLSVSVSQGEWRPGVFSLHEIVLLWYFLLAFLLELKKITKHRRMLKECGAIFLQSVLLLQQTKIGK